MKRHNGFLLSFALAVNLGEPTSSVKYLESLSNPAWLSLARDQLKERGGCAI
jgi:hypothetical protein